MKLKQWIILCVAGIVLWFLAALLIRVLSPLGALDDGARVLTYLLVIPGTAPFIWGLVQLADLRTGQVGLGAAIATMTAMFFDGIALGWFAGLYGSVLSHQAMAGAVILWGAAIAIATGFVFDHLGWGKRASMTNES